FVLRVCTCWPSVALKMFLHEMKGFSIKPNALQEAWLRPAQGSVSSCWAGPGGRYQGEESGRNQQAKRRGHAWLDD
ncbi:MAG: hypothetical protein ACREX0_02030, partial [Noviherbaspirillum sp.]